MPAVLNASDEGRGGGQEVKASLASAKEFIIGATILSYFSLDLDCVCFFKRGRENGHSVVVKS